MEEWRDIEWYEGIYQISNKGNIRSLGKYQKVHGKLIFVERTKLLNPSDNGNGYLIIGLCNGKKRKNYYIHRLVAESFLIKETGKDYVNHKDYNIANNIM